MTGQAACELEPTPAQARLLDELAVRESAMIARVAAWSRINSGSRHRQGLDRMRSTLMQAFAELGGEMEELALPAGEVVEPNGTLRSVEYAPAIRIRCRPQATVRVALTGHYDTVFPAESAFQDVAEGAPGTLVGPGVADMKGGLVVMLESLRCFERSPGAEHLGWAVLISPDEELGSPGSCHVLTHLGKWAHVGMTYEPASPDGSLAGARKGSGSFVLVARGKAAHAGREHQVGRNAVVAAARFAAGLAELDGTRDGVTFNVAKVEGGGPVNVVPDLGICRFGIRFPTDADARWAEAEIGRLVDTTCTRHGITAQVKGGFTRPPKPMAPANRQLFDFTRAIGNVLGLDLAWHDTGGVCEGNNLWAAGCPNVDTLGVRGGALHSSEEYVVLSSLVERTRLSALILMKMASGAFDARRLRVPGLGGAPQNSTASPGGEASAFRGERTLSEPGRGLPFLCPLLETGH
ncbi:MAG: hydrolase [Polyangiaceae bacterium]|nr:hydrolase [Polyangiaceae bacterium]